MATKLTGYELEKAYSAMHGHEPPVVQKRSALWSLRRVAHTLTEEELVEGISVHIREAVDRLKNDLRDEIAALEVLIGAEPTVDLKVKMGMRIETFQFVQDGKGRFPRVGRVVAINGDKALVAIEQTSHHNKSVTFTEIPSTYKVEMWETMDGTNEPLPKAMDGLASYNHYGKDYSKVPVPSEWLAVLSNSMKEWVRQWDSI